MRTNREILIGYFYDKSSFIRFKRRIFPLIINQNNNFVLKEYNIDEKLDCDVLILLSIPKNKLFIRKIINKEICKLVIYDNTNDLSLIISPGIIRKIIWFLISIFKGEKHLSLLHKELIKSCDLVVSGSKLQMKSNSELNQNTWFIVDPLNISEYPYLVVDTNKVIPKIPYIIWEGTNSSMVQLKQIVKPIISLQKIFLFKFQIVSNIENKKDEKFLLSLKKEGLLYEFIEWTLESFKNSLSHASIALAPIDTKSNFGNAKPCNKILTYWGYKLPVVASNIESYADIVIEKHNGFICNCEKDWVDALIYLLENPNKMIEIGENGFNKAVKEYNDQLFATKYFNKINELLNKATMGS